MIKCKQISSNKFFKTPETALENFLNEIGKDKLIQVVPLCFTTSFSYTVIYEE